MLVCSRCSVFQDELLKNKIVSKKSFLSSYGKSGFILYYERRTQYKYTVDLRCCLSRRVAERSRPLRNPTRAPEIGLHPPEHSSEMYLSFFSFSIV